ncbi:MAG: InlB B-repeat-containing protein [Clostridiales bacterium]|nr:InlB B-repeat-containing protein [Clostridiales bacterium]
MSEYKGMGRSRKRKETMASRICGKMRRMKRFLSTAVCVSMIGSSVLNPAMLVYADSDEEEVQEFELESEAIGQAITEAIADDSLVSAEDLGFSGAEEDTYAELFAEDGLLYEVKPEIDETKDDDGDLDLRIFVRLDVVELLDEGETLDGYEITGEEDVFFMLVNDTDTEQNAIVIVDGKETDVITVAPESEVAETAVADDAEIAIPAGGGSGAAEAEVSDEEAEVTILDEDVTEDAESADDTEDAEPADDTEDAGSEEDTEDMESEDDTEDAGSEEDTEDMESEDDTEGTGSEEDTEDVESEDDTEDAGSEEDTEDVESEEDTEDAESADNSDDEDTEDEDSADDTNDDAETDDSSDGETDTDSDSSESSNNNSNNDDSLSEVASISVHKYSLLAVAASPADAEESEVEVVVSEDSGLLDGELYEAVAMEDGAAVVFVTTTSELGLAGIIAENTTTYTAETETAVITAVVPDGAFDEEVSLYAEDINEDSDQYDEVMQSVDSQASESGMVNYRVIAYDIYFQNADGEEVEPNEDANIQISVSVLDESTFAASEGKTVSVSVYHITDEGEVESVSTDTEKDESDVIQSVNFELSSFSIIALAAEEYIEATLQKGVNVISTSTSGESFDISDGYAVMIEGTDGDAIEFTDCEFKLSGSTIKISGTQAREDGGSVIYYNGEVATKLFIGKNVTFTDCTFTGTDGTRQGTQGWDAAIYFFGGDIELNNCRLTGNNWYGQFLGLYGSSGSVTFTGCTIATEGNVGGWSYAMYGASVLNLIDSEMTATGMLRASGGGNINAFYSGDLRTSYDAVNITNSTINFSDNQAGGFAINNVNIHVTNSNITVNDNLGNACNSGYWIVDNSSIKMDGNRGGHGLSCIGIEMTDSILEILHNGYAGLYIQTKNSNFTNSMVDIRCNGEKLLSYSAGDVWLNSHTLTIANCTSQAESGSAWLGAVGRKGAVVSDLDYVETEGSSTVVAYDLNSNAADKLKSNTTATLEEASLALNDETEDGHTLLLNPWMTSDYARGNGESTSSNNDADLFADDKIANGTYTEDYVTAQNTIITVENEDGTTAEETGDGTAKVGVMTTAQLSHHKYDWSSYELVKAARVENGIEHYGVIKYECTDVCSDHKDWTSAHTYSFDCAGTYVYAPLVELRFDANIGTSSDLVLNMPSDQDRILYDNAGTEPGETPYRSGYTFTGWYIDPECTVLYDFATTLTVNQVVYAGWEAGEIETPVLDWDVSKSKTAEQLDENYESQVTLSLPSAEVDLVSDIVFVLDKSTSPSLEEQALAMLSELKETIAGTEAKVNVGVVIFNKEAHETGFLDLETQYDLIDEAFRQDIESGTNTHAGLLAGKALLDSDTSVAASRKYLIFVSDGISYIFGEEPTAVAWTFTVDNAESSWDGPDNWKVKYGSNDAPESWESWLSIVKGQVETDAGKYDYPYGGTQGETTPAEEYQEHAMSVDKALYETYSVFCESIEAGYHCYSLTAETGKGEEYLWGPSYMGYLSGLSGNETVDFSVIENDILYLLGAGSYVIDYMGYVEDDYNFDFVDDADKLQIMVGGTTVYEAELISQDENSSRYGFGKQEDGSYLYELDYFPGDLKYNEYFIWYINVKVSNFETVQLTYSVKLAEPKTESGTYGEYDRDGSGDSTELYTNRVATLYPKDSEGNEGDPEDFPMPTVSYTVEDSNPTTPTDPTTPETPVEEDETGDLTVTKEVTGSGGSTTKEFTFTVTLDDTSINGTYGDMTFENGVATFTLKSGESKTATGLPAGIGYTVTETAASGYTTSVDGTTTLTSSGSIESGNTITVTFTNYRAKSSSSSNHGGGGGSSSSSSTSGTTAGSSSGPGVSSSDSGSSSSDPGDPGDPASSPDLYPLAGLPKTGDNGTNTSMVILLLGMIAVAYVILSGRRKDDKD